MKKIFFIAAMLVMSMSMFAAQDAHAAVLETKTVSFGTKPMLAPNCFCKADVAKFHLAPWCGPIKKFDMCYDHTSKKTLKLTPGKYHVKIKVGGLTASQRHEEVYVYMNRTRISVPDLGGNNKHTGTGTYDAGLYTLGGNVSFWAKHKYADTFTGRWYSDQESRIGSHNAAESVFVSTIVLERIGNKPVDGKCNSAVNGKVLKEKPSHNSLCSSGKPSAITGNGTPAHPWTWTCIASYGGKNAVCHATKRPDPIVCGNGKVETGEQCDDGNTRSHDGCSSQCRVEHPAITVHKNDADNGDDTQTIDKGATASFTITVKNTGAVDLKNVKVTDAKAPQCNKTIGNLTVGQEKSYTCQVANVTKSFTNVAAVIGTPVNNTPGVTDTDPTAIIVTIPGIPAIAIDKDDADNGDDTQTIDKGATASFTITVRNTGAVDLKNVKVTDAKEPHCNKTIGNLAVGEEKTYTCTGGATQDAYTNTAHVVGTPTDGQGNVSGSDDTAIVIRTPQGPICGNGKVETGEQCDDGNTTNGDGCSAQCTTETAGPVCGNGKVETGEQCDDGNTTNGDGCSAQCTTETAGPVCGNGKVETGEECDGGDSCTSSCTLERETEGEPKKKCKASIGDLVWNDRNKNGEQDAGEEGISGVRVKLVQGDSVDYETTDSDGNYVFRNLCAHTYRVIVAAETLPEGCYQTYDKNGPLDHKSKHYLDRKDKVRDADFGYYCPTQTVYRTSPATGAGAGAAGVATLLASGAAYLSYRRTRKDALSSTIIDMK